MHDCIHPCIHPSFIYLRESFHSWRRLPDLLEHHCTHCTAGLLALGPLGMKTFKH
jgi:hypothetical protein